MSVEQVNQIVKDENGNCRKCGHPLDNHDVVAYDVNDFSKGGELRCPVENCKCSMAIKFNPKPE